MESASNSTLEAEFSMLDDEFFGDRSQENDTDIDLSGSDSDETEDECTNVEVQPQDRDVDIEEAEAVKTFVESTCGCSKRNGTPCSGYFDQDEYEEAQGCLWLNWRRSS